MVEDAAVATVARPVASKTGVRCRAATDSMSGCDAEPLGREQHVPDRSKSETARWIPAAGKVWRWTTANSSRGSAMRCSNWWSRTSGSAESSVE